MTGEILCVNENIQTEQDRNHCFFFYLPFSAKWQWTMPNRSSLDSLTMKILIKSRKRKRKELEYYLDTISSTQGKHFQLVPPHVTKQIKKWLFLRSTTYTLHTYISALHIDCYRTLQWKTQAKSVATVFYQLLKWKIGKLSIGKQINFAQYFLGVWIFVTFGFAKHSHQQST